MSAAYSPLPGRMPRSTHRAHYRQWSRVTRDDALQHRLTRLPEPDEAAHRLRLVAQAHADEHDWLGHLASSAPATRDSQPVRAVAGGSTRAVRPRPRALAAVAARSPGTS